MRISSLSQPRWMLTTLQNSNQQINKLSEQLSTQKKYAVPSDDPLSTARAASLTQQQSVTDQYQKNITATSGALSSQETLLTSMNNQLMSLQDLFRSMNNASHTANLNQGYASQIGTISDSLVSLLNSQDADGHYIFAGTNNTQPPVVKIDGQYRWQGNDQSATAQVGQQNWVDRNTPLPQLLAMDGDAMGYLNQLTAMQTALSTGSPDDSPSSDTLGKFIAQSDSISNQLTVNIASIGHRQNQLTQLSNVYTDLSTANSEVLSNLQDTDVAESSMQIQAWLQTVQYTSKAYSLINQFSLFDVI